MQNIPALYKIPYIDILPTLRVKRFTAYYHMQTHLWIATTHHSGLFVFLGSSPMVKVLMVKYAQSIFPIMTGERSSCSVRIEVLHATGVWISISYLFYTRFSIDEDSSVPFVYTFTLQLSNPVFQLLTHFKVSIGCALLLQLVSIFRTNSVDFFSHFPFKLFPFLYHE